MNEEIALFTSKSLTKSRPVWEMRMEMKELSGGCLRRDCEGTRKRERMRRRRR